MSISLAPEIQFDPNRKRPRIGIRSFVAEEGLLMKPWTTHTTRKSSLALVQTQDCVLGELSFKAFAEMEDGIVHDCSLVISNSVNDSAVYFLQRGTVCAVITFLLRSSDKNLIQAMACISNATLSASGTISIDNGILTASMLIGLPPGVQREVNLLPLWEMWVKKELSTNMHLPNIVLSTPPVEFNPKEFQHSAISVRLYPYQCRAIQWLLYKEGVYLKDGVVHFALTPRYHPLVWTCVGEGLYLNQCNGTICRGNIPVEPLGGILCDEMGMGKTIMIIALVLLHRCQSISTLSENIRLCKATLIVTPKSILSQWINEIKRHATQLRYFVYEGNEDGIECVDDMDIVFSPYDVMKKELHLANPGREGPRRHNRAHTRRKSFFMSRTWWRVVLDEAQMVESNVSAVATMVKRIPRIHPWSVTGTPTPKHGSIKEMNGLFEFIGSPITSEWLETLTQSDFEKVLRHYVHKDTKDNVKSEMTLPPQSDYTYCVPFKPIEAQYYSDLVEMAVREVGEEPSEPLPIPDSPDRLLVLQSKKAWKDYEDLQSARLAKMNSWVLRLRQTWYRILMQLPSESIQ
jgi:SNF2 family DNA or RNA helicase